MSKKQPSPFKEKHATLLSTDHLIVETFCGKSAGKQKFRSYFLYASKPTNWRVNWRRIRGFYVCVFGYYLILAVWQ